MIMTAFCFYDAKVGIFHNPMFFLHRGQALRTAQELASDPQTVMGRHPADFILYEVGTFNDQTGAMETVAPISLGPCTQFLTQQTLPFMDPDVAAAAAERRG